MKVITEVEISDQTLVDIIDGSDIGYWAGDVTWPGAAAILDGSKTATIIDRDRDGKKYTLDAKAIFLGLQTMCGYERHHFDNILSGNWDCETGDVLIQCALFGETIYG